MLGIIDITNMYVKQGVDMKHYSLHLKYLSITLNSRV